MERIIFMIVAITGLIITLCLIAYIIKYLCWDLIRSEVKVDYGKIVDKEIRTKTYVENTVIGKDIVPMTKVQVEHIIKVKFKDLVFDCDCSSLYDKVRKGDKVRLRYNEYKGNVFNVQLLEVIS